MARNDSKIPKILLVGQKYSGKSSSAKYISDRIPGTILFALARPIKDILRDVFFLSNDQLYDEKLKEVIDPRWGVSPRKLMQKVGDLLRDELPRMLPELKIDHGTIITENMYLRLKELDDMKEGRPPLIIIEDGRFPDEHKFFKTFPEGISVRINRNTGLSDLHVSEQIPFTCDRTIDNNGSIEELHAQLDSLIIDILGVRSTS